MPYQPGSLPSGVVLVIAAVDVQADRLIYVVRGWGARATSWLIDNGDLWGPTDQLEVWGQLSDVLQDDYGERQIKIAFVDSGFRPGKKDRVPENRVYEFCRRHQRFVFPTKGYDTMQRPLVRSRIEVTPQGGTMRFGLDLIRLNSDWWKTWVHERIRWPATEPGAWFLHEQVDEGYCKQIVSEARTRSPSGRPVWVPSSRENHALDAEAMNAAAGWMLGVHRIGARGRPLDQPLPTSSALAPLAMRAPRQDTASRFADFARRFNNPRG